MASLGGTMPCVSCKEVREFTHSCKTSHCGMQIPSEVRWEFPGCDNCTVHNFSVTLKLLGVSPIELVSFWWPGNQITRSENCKLPLEPRELVSQGDSTCVWSSDSGVSFPMDVLFLKWPGKNYTATKAKEENKNQYTSPLKRKCLQS